MYSYQEALAQREESVVKYGLERMQAMMERVGRPDKAYRIIHVAGTNGKGSVVAMLDSVLRAQGLRVGAYNSPHLVSIHERIRINGNLVTDDQFEEAYKIIAPFCIVASHFELVTALAFIVFKLQQVDVAIVEVGLGGRLDATNIVTPIMSIITSLSYDHQNLLGQSLMDIAKEKAGIIKPGVPIICAASGAEGKHIEEIARQKNSLVLRPVVPKWKTNLLGSHQQQNLALVEMALRRMPWNISPEAAKQALEHVIWPGRLQYLAPDLLIDAAHNADGMHSFCDFVKSKPPMKIIAGFSSDKDIVGMINQLRAVSSAIVYAPFSWKRSWNPLAYVSFFRDTDYVAASPKEAIERAKKQEGPWAVCGSIFLLGEILSALNITSQDLFDPVGKVYKQTLDWRS